MNAPLQSKSTGCSSSRPPVAGEALRAITPSLDREARQLVEQIGILLASQGHALAVGETSAGGTLASLIHDLQQNGSWFRGGIVLYSGSDVPLAQSIRCVARDHGVVNEEYAAALAELVKRTFACDWALTESGVAGPQTGRRSAKPVGMVCLAAAGPKLTQEVTQERGTSPRATSDTLAKREQVWVTTRMLGESGRTGNQYRFAVESLRFLFRMLEAHTVEE